MVPVNEPLLDGKEKEYLLACIESGWISSEGPFVRQFEERFAARMGRKYGIAVANGTAALEAAVAALEIREGDEVIVPAFTIISCAGAVVRAGAIPVLVDCDPGHWNMDPEKLEATVKARLKAGNRLKAIMVVHIYGQPTDMDPVLRIAREHGLKIIEDAAEMHGQTYRGRPCGGFGELSTFSFYPNKHITTGEGGMILTDDEALAERCRSLRNLCFDKERRYIHKELGWNLRMTNLQAALGLAQLERLDEFVAKKRRIGAWYNQGLASVPGLQLPIAQLPYAENIYWVYAIMLKDEVDFDAVEMVRRLGERKIGCRHFFWPMHKQPALLDRGLFRGERYPVSEKLAERGFYIPSGLALTESQKDEVVGVLREVMK